MNRKIFLLFAFFCATYSTDKHYTIYQYDNGDDYVQDGTIRIVDPQTGKIGYATPAPEAKVIIEPRFAFGYPFENGKAKVTYHGSLKSVPNSQGEYHYWDSDDWFYIDKQGRPLSPQTSSPQKTN